MKYFMYFEKSMRAVTINCESTLPGLIIYIAIYRAMIDASNRNKQKVAIPHRFKGAP